MATGYSINKPRAEREVLEIWENEGGGPRQHQDYRFNSIGEDYQRHTGAIMPIGTSGKPNEFPHAMLLRASKHAKSITGQTLVVFGEQTLPQSVFVV